MSRHEEFWARVDALLDERRDPLQDAEVQRLIADAPALLDEWARFEDAVAAARPPRRRSRVALAATILALTAVGVAAWSIRTTPVEPLVLAGDGGRSRVLSIHATVEHIDARGTTTITFDGTTRTRTFVARTPDHDAADRPSLFFATTFVSTRSEHQP